MTVTTPPHPPRWNELPLHEIQRSLREEALVKEARERARRRRQRYGAVAALVAVVGASVVLSAWHDVGGGAAARPSQGPASQSGSVVVSSSLIAFSSWDYSREDLIGGNVKSAIYTIRPDGTDRRQLTDYADSSWPTVSPDGREIAVQVGGASSGASIDVMKIDGSDRRTLVRGGQSPSWSPDGTRIAYSLSAPGPRGGIYTVGLKDRFTQRLTVEGWFPAWSPDGRRIAYECGPTGPSAFWICVVNSDGSGRRVATRRGGLRPVWSPDGTEIAFQRFAAQPGSPRSGRIMIINADGGRSRTLPTPIHYKNVDCVPAWSPDGKQIAFTPSFLEGDGIYLASSNGNGTATQLKGTHGLDGCGISWQSTPNTNH